MSLDGSPDEFEAESIPATFALYRSDDGSFLSNISEGQIFDSGLADVPLNIRVNPDIAIESVEITGGDFSPGTENASPYFAFGDSGGNIIGRGEVLGPGMHVVTARFFSENGLQGDFLGETILTFEIMGGGSERIFRDGFSAGLIRTRTTQ